MGEEQGQKEKVITIDVSEQLEMNWSRFFQWLMMFVIGSIVGSTSFAIAIWIFKLIVYGER